MKPKLEEIAGQPCWKLRSRDVELAVTRLGGHMAPVRFDIRSSRPVQPYYISPWQGENLKIDEPVLVPLRGDFFCLPFGENGKHRGQVHRVHGEPAGRKWDLVGVGQEGDLVRLTMKMKTTQIPGRITKNLSLIDGQNAIYIQHVLEGFSGRYPLGHHATLRMPDKPESVLLSTSPIRFAMTCDHPTGLPEGGPGEYQALATDKKFASLKKVPLIWKSPSVGDYTALPTRPGFTDILALFSKPRKQPAWTAAVFADEGFLWYAMKDANVQPSTVMWIANRGRHNPPWNGRNCCVGLEDVCAYFADGFGPSVKKNPISEAGIPTAIKLSRRTPTRINYIHGVVKAPRGFGRVRTARFAAGRVTFVSETGKEATAEVNHEFLTTGEPMHR